MGKLLKVLAHAPMAVLLAFVVAGAPAPSASAEYPDFTEVCGPYFGTPEPLRPNHLPSPPPWPHDEPWERPADPPEPAVIYPQEQPCDPADGPGFGFFDQAAQMLRAAWRWIMPG